FGFTFGWLSRMVAGGAVSYGAYVAVWEREDGEDFRITAYHSRSSIYRLPLREGFQLLANGSGAGGVPHEGGMEEQRRSVVAADTAFAALSVAQGYSIAFPTYASDFMMVFGGNFVGLEGHEEIANAYAGWTPAEVLEWAPVYAGAAASGDLAYTVGTAVDSYTMPDGNVVKTWSKYLTLWARTADGAWRFVADGGSSSPAPAP
ncbi:MAG: YybH family protein, partial [Deltaproteobacteria bacterium]